MEQTVKAKWKEGGKENFKWQLTSPSHWGSKICPPEDSCLRLPAPGLRIPALSESCDIQKYPLWCGHWKDRDHCCQWTTQLNLVCVWDSHTEGNKLAPEVSGFAWPLHSSCLGNLKRSHCFTQNLARVGFSYSRRPSASHSSWWAVFIVSQQIKNTRKLRSLAASVFLSFSKTVSEEAVSSLSAAEVECLREVPGLILKRDPMLHWYTHSLNEMTMNPTH